MSRFFSSRLADLVPYTPGEQPREDGLLKLNTNELPFPPSPRVLSRAQELTRALQLYPDPDCTLLRRELAQAWGLEPEQILCGNGSDEILSFAFQAFCSDDRPALFPDLTYGFYPVFARANRVPWREIPLREDFSVVIDDYRNLMGTVFLANPNAPTGLQLSPGEIEVLVRQDRGRVVVIDEAYVDFSRQSALPLIRHYDNLLVVRTFSKSRALAGARLGFGLGDPALIADLNRVRCSFNPYNVSSPAQALGRAILEEEDSVPLRCGAVVQTREKTVLGLRERGFSVTDSRANFVFAAPPHMGGETLFHALREKGILVRRFDKPRIAEYLRITVGTDAQMDRFFAALDDIGKEAGGL